MPTFIVLAHADVTLQKQYRFIVQAVSEADAVQQVLSGNADGEELPGSVLSPSGDGFVVQEIKPLEEGRVEAFDSGNDWLLLSYGKGLEAYFRIPNGLESLPDRLEVGDLVGFHAERGCLLICEKLLRPELRFEESPHGKHRS